MTIRTSADKYPEQSMSYEDRLFVKDLNTGKKTTGIDLNRLRERTDGYKNMEKAGGNHYLHFSKIGEPFVLVSKVGISNSRKNYNKYIDLKECKIKPRTRKSPITLEDLDNYKV